MIITLPIKDKKDIKLIKNLYKKKEQYNHLLLFLLSINTGMLLTDLIELKVSSLRNKDYIIIRKGITYTLPPEIKDLILTVTKYKAPNDYIFTSIGNNKISRHCVYRNFKSICAELGLQNISIDSWRKTFGYQYYMKYKDLFFLQWYFNQVTAEQALDYIDIHEQMSSRFEKGLNL